MTFERIDPADILEYSRDGGWIKVRRRDGTHWVQIVQITPDRIDYRHFQDLFEFYLIGSEQAGFV